MCSSDLTLYIYYDSAQPDNSGRIGDTGDAASQNVWDSYFKLVMHMAQDPVSGSIKDSTANALHWTPGNMDASNLGYASSGKSFLTFNGTNAYLTHADSAYLSPGSGAFHLVALFRTTADCIAREAEGTIYDDYGTSKVAILSFKVSDTPATANKIRAITLDDSSHISEVDSSSTVNDGNWHLFSASRSAVNNLDAVLDGSGLTSDTGTCGTITTSLAIAPQIGRQSSFLVNYFDGDISEIRYSNTKRAVAWDKATYNTLLDSLLTFAEEGIFTAVSVDVPSALCALLSLVPAVNPYHVAGIVQEQGSAVARTVRLYDRSTGALVDSVVSDAGDGSFDFSDIDGKVYTVIAFDADAGSDFNALIYDRVQATQAS